MAGPAPWCQPTLRPRAPRAASVSPRRYIWGLSLLEGYANPTLFPGRMGIWHWNEVVTGGILVASVWLMPDEGLPSQPRYDSRAGQGVASLEEARDKVVNWCWEHSELVVGREEPETAHLVQYQRFLDASANIASSALGQ